MWRHGDLDPVAVDRLGRCLSVRLKEWAGQGPNLRLMNPLHPEAADV